MFCCSSMSVASAEGSLWETAVAILMLRHSMMMKTPNCPEAKNMWVWAREGRETTGRSSSEVALRTPPNDNEAPPEKRRNGGGDVFSGGCARRACGVAAAGRWHGGGFFNDNTKRMTPQLRLAQANNARRNENR